MYTENLLWWSADVPAAPAVKTRTTLLYTFIWQRRSGLSLQTPFRPSWSRNSRYELNDTEMFSFVARSANVTSAAVAATQSVANGTKSVIPAVSIQADRALVPPPAQKLTNNSLAASLPVNALKASATLGGMIL